MTAEEARAITNEVRNGRLKTCISNAEFEIKRECQERRHYINFYVPSELFYDVTAHFEKNGFSVVQITPSSKWSFRKENLPNMRIEW